jgi:hypothetical protein
MEQVIIGGRSPQAVGDHRSHRPRPATTRGGSLHYRRGWIRRHAQVRQGVAGSGLGDRGANGVGRPLAQRLLESGERVIDVPAKLAARARLFDTGHNRKTDAHDAHSVAVVAARTSTLRELKVDGELEALRMLTEAALRQTIATVATSTTVWWLRTSCPRSRWPTGSWSSTSVASAQSAHTMTFSKAMPFTRNWPPPSSSPLNNRPERRPGTAAPSTS